MNIYIASRFGRKNEVCALHEQLKRLGHNIIEDWTVHADIKPYEHHAELSRQYAVDDARGAMNCDVFILLTDESGTGMYTELGAALASRILRGTPRICVTGAHIDRSFFYFHPEVERYQTVEEVVSGL